MIPSGPELGPTLGPIRRSVWARSECWPAFLAPEWVESWIEAYGLSCGTYGLVWSVNDEAVAYCFIARYRDKRGPLSVRRLSLNGSEKVGRGAEHHDLLATPGYKAPATFRLVQHVLGDTFDELSPDGVDGKDIHGNTRDGAE